MTGDTDTVFEQNGSTGAEDEDLIAEELPVKAPLWKRLLLGAAFAFAALFLVTGVLYRFGSMWFPDPEIKARYDTLVTTGAVPDTVKQQFHIPIPGCVCHSDDPVVTMQHSTRRISQCMECHGR